MTLLYPNSPFPFFFSSLVHLEGRDEVSQELSISFWRVSLGSFDFSFIFFAFPPLSLYRSLILCLGMASTVSRLYSTHQFSLFCKYCVDFSKISREPSTNTDSVADGEKRAAMSPFHCPPSEGSTILSLETQARPLDFRFYGRIIGLVRGSTFTCLLQLGLSSLCSREVHLFRFFGE